MTKIKKSDYDTPWKDVLESFFESFMSFFFPHAHEDIDWTKGFEHKDGELRKIIPHQKEGLKVADKLVQVTLKDGQQTWVFIHVEIQNQFDQHFEERMYRYYFRIREKFKHKVASFALLGDSNDEWKPSVYREGIWNTELVFRYEIRKLLSYNNRWEWLQQQDNPFAIVVMAHLKDLEIRNNIQSRFDWKIWLTQELFRRNWDENQVVELQRFIDWLYELPEDLDIQYQKTISKGANNMKYIAAFERRAEARGEERGEKRGIELGQGRILSKLLKLKFGTLPEWVSKKMEDAKVDQLELWSERVLTAQTPEEIFEN